MPVHIVVFILCLATLWMSSELIISSMSKFTKRLNVSAFAASFFILGMLTSIPEISIGINAVIDKKPEVFVGNLIGASVVLFLLIIPLLAVLGNGIKVNHNLPDKHLLFTLFVVLVPAYFTLDGRVNKKEAIIMIVVYLFLFYLLEKKKGLLELFNNRFKHKNKVNSWDMVKIVLGCVVTFIASRALVKTLTPMAAFFGVPTFVLSLLILSVGTNLPELFLALMSVIKKQKDVAFGDYLGSAAANTLLYGVLIGIYGNVTLNGGEYFATFILFLVGLTAFFFFVRSKQEISRKEGLILLALYGIFVASEIVLK